MLTTGRARQARPTPAAGPLPRGYIDTGDLMPTERAQQINRAGVAAVPPPTAVIPALPVHTSRTIAAAPGFAVGRPPTLPPPDKTVYVSLNRPDGWSNEDWRVLTLRVGRLFEADWIVQRAETSVSAAVPMIVWVLTLPADLVVEVQGRLLEVLDVRPRPARAIWAEATPRTLGGTS
jgi:hypothetical protein